VFSKLIVLEKNKIFSSLLVVITLIAIIFLVILGDSIEEKSDETSTNPVMPDSLELNVEPEQSLKSEINELNNQINDFLFTDKLDSNESNVNVYSIELDE
jgi:hypothetical protein